MLSKVIVKVAYEFQMSPERAAQVVGRELDPTANNHAWESELEAKMGHLAPTLTLASVTAPRPKVEVE